jgi:hypothetical protein
MKRTALIFAAGVGAGAAVVWARGARRRYTIRVNRLSAPRELWP